jgi:uncharacterized membrane protein YdfJ with MMPL/SSD domain
VIRTLSTTGRGILFNALSVIVGFLVLIISSFTPIRYFGVLVVVSIFSCLTGALVVLPALLLRRNYSFLYPEEAVASEQPEVASEQSAVAIEQPEVTSGQPAVAIEQPEVASTQPAAGSEHEETYKKAM